MRPIDWTVLAASLLFMVLYGIRKGRKSRDLDHYFLSNRDMRWPVVAFSIMATQASAITFLSTPGQAFTDGMRFVQFYFGLPLAMVVLSITAVPIFHRLKVFTAYEYLETRFDAKTRILAAGFFLVQRGLACGLTIYAPALILSVLLGWNLHITNILIGGLVILYTTSGGTRAVGYTQVWQMTIVLGTLFATFLVIVSLLPAGVGLGDATFVAGKLGKLNAIDFSFSFTSRYNIWSGLIGGFFLALSYFGTDQSQVARYLSGRSIAESRLGLLFNGIIKVPMQFGILFIGAMVFAFYQFNTPPVFFNSVETARASSGSEAVEFSHIENEYKALSLEKQVAVKTMVRARQAGDEALIERSLVEAEELARTAAATRSRAIDLMERGNPRMDRSDTNYVFLGFILRYLPAGLIGLVLAAVFAASMSSSASELNALSSTSTIDMYRRIIRRDASEQHYLFFSKGATFAWGAFAIFFAEYASRLGSLVEAVNILGSLFYGTVLGLFLLAFHFKRVGGTAAFTGALFGEGVVIASFFYGDLSFLWYNVVGCLVTVIVASAVQTVAGR